jgi:hypothetical protein
VSYFDKPFNNKNFRRKKRLAERIQARSDGGNEPGFKNAMIWFELAASKQEVFQVLGNPQDPTGIHSKLAKRPDFGKQKI